MSLTRSTSLAFPGFWERRSMTRWRSPMASSYAAIAVGTSDLDSFESSVTACCARRSASVNSSRDDGRGDLGGDCFSTLRRRTYGGGRSEYGGGGLLDIWCVCVVCWVLGLIR